MSYQVHYDLGKQKKDGLSLEHNLITDQLQMHYLWEKDQIWNFTEKVFQIKELELKCIIQNI